MGVAKVDLKYCEHRQIVCGILIESCTRDRRRLSNKIIDCIGYRRMLHAQWPGRDNVPRTAVIVVVVIILLVVFRYNIA